ncbi:MAG: hypothetical protein K6E98_11375 [Lachnospiraceae bacterium]|nr:hypothetical protein [Lachnospiraceae bacterium]
MAYNKPSILTERIKQEEDFVIYGAQVVAYGAYCAIKELTGKKPLCFVVGTMEGNPKEIDGIPVMSIEKVPINTFIVIGVTELVQKEVIPKLSDLGYLKLFPLTQHEEHVLMSTYFQRIGKFPLA